MSNFALKALVKDSMSFPLQKMGYMSLNLIVNTSRNRNLNFDSVRQHWTRANTTQPAAMERAQAGLSTLTFALPLISQRNGKEIRSERLRLYSNNNNALFDLCPRTTNRL